MKKRTTYLFLFLAVLSCSAQETLSLQQAIETALKNNFAINIGKTQAAAAKSNNNIGAAGFLPTVSLNASTNYSNNNINQEYSTGLNINKNGVVSSGINSGVLLNWTVFDGLRMFATKERLSQLQQQGELNVKVQIENSIAAIITAYYDVVRQQQLIKATGEAIKLYDEQIKISQKKLDIGSGAKPELLQAKVDMNAQKAALLKYNAALDNAKVTLNQLMARQTDMDFTVNDSVIVDYKPSYDELKKSLVSKNNQILFAQKNININEQIVKEQRSFWLPQIGVNASYNFTQSRNQAGLVLLNQNLGLNTGLTATWAIFNGWKTHTLIKNAQYNLQVSELQYQQVTSVVESNLIKTWKNFYVALEAMKLEEDNILIAQENVNIALERFRIGSANSLEILIAQRSFSDATARLVSARYDAKAAETELRRLNGELVK